MNEAHFKKGEIVQKKDTLNSKMYHVKKGLLRSYTIDEKGKEHIFMFAPEQWIIADATPPWLPCDLYIDALEDTEVFCFEKSKSYDDLSSIDGKKVASLMRRIYVLQQRVIMLMSAPAIERFEAFESTYPKVMQRVPQKMIASYLGITPQALSKIKGKRMLKNSSKER